MSNIILRDGFIFMDVSDKAKEIWNSGIFSLYELHEDGSESMIEDDETLLKVLESDNPIAISVGYLTEVPNSHIGYDVKHGNGTMSRGINLPTLEEAINIAKAFKSVTKGNNPAMTAENIAYWNVQSFDIVENITIQTIKTTI